MTEPSTTPRYRVYVWGDSDPIAAFRSAEEAQSYQQYYCPANGRVEDCRDPETELLRAAA